MDLSENDPLGAILAQTQISKKESDEDKFRELTYEQEIYLKKLLIKNCLEKEYNEFASKNSFSITFSFLTAIRGYERRKRISTNRSERFLTICFQEKFGGLFII
jgi:hypothetical protein